MVSLFKKSRIIPLTPITIGAERGGVGGAPDIRGGLVGPKAPGPFMVFKIFAVSSRAPKSCQ